MTLTIRASPGQSMESGKVFLRNNFIHEVWSQRLLEERDIQHWQQTPLLYGVHCYEDEGLFKNKLNGSRKDRKPDHEDAYLSIRAF